MVREVLNPIHRRESNFNDSSVERNINEDFEILYSDRDHLKKKKKAKRII